MRLPNAHRRLPLAAVVALASWSAGCSGSGSTGPEPVTVTFDVQPSDVTAGSEIEPPIEVGTGTLSPTTVSLGIADNDCGATLGGVTTRSTSTGLARFPGLTLDIPANDYRLEARVGQQAQRSAAFEVSPVPLAGPLEQRTSVCIRDHANGDAASLVFVSRDGVLWTADDNREEIFAFDRTSGARVSAITRQDLLAAFPDAADCDDGDGDPTSLCSYVHELEVVSMDPVGGFLYAFNTVNDPGSPQIVDRAAVFRFRLGACRGCLTADDWQPLPAGYTYRAAVTIDGVQYIADKANLHRYDFDANEVTAQPALPTTHGTISGLAYANGTLFLLTHSLRLVTIDWENGTVSGTYELAPVGLREAAGVEAVGDLIYLLEGRVRNPVYVIRIKPGS